MSVGEEIETEEEDQGREKVQLNPCSCVNSQLEASGRVRRCQVSNSQANRRPHTVSVDWRMKILFQCRGH